MLALVRACTTTSISTSHAHLSRITYDCPVLETSDTCACLNHAFTADSIAYYVFTHQALVCSWIMQCQAAFALAAKLRGTILFYMMHHISRKLLRE